MDIEINKIMNIDCLEGMNYIKPGSIDMIFSDLPYGTTNCDWDCALPLHDYAVFRGKLYTYEELILHNFKNQWFSNKDVALFWNEHFKSGLWSHYKRIIKDNGAIVLFSQSPFDKVLGNSNLGMYRYEWIWEKTHATGHYNAKKAPMKAHENLLVFYKLAPTYNPQKTTGHSPTHSFKKSIEIQNKMGQYNKATREIVYCGGDTERYPRDVLMFSSDKQVNKGKPWFHSTQKPVDLCEYMIKTYTNEGEIVFDGCMGSGTTAVACINTNRNYIGFEKDKKIFRGACERVRNIQNN